jgi:hypothetical protein
MDLEATMALLPNYQINPPTDSSSDSSSSLKSSYLCEWRQEIPPQLGKEEGKQVSG